MSILCTYVHKVSGYSLYLGSQSKWVPRLTLLYKFYLKHVSDDEIRVRWDVRRPNLQDLSRHPVAVEIGANRSAAFEAEKERLKILVYD